MIYTLPKDTEITAQVIKDAIDYNEKRRPRFDLLDKYYIGDQAITHREKPDILRNNRVMVNHAKYIVDTNVGYLLGNPVDYQVTDGINIEPLLDIYKKQTMNDIDSEIAKDCAIFGMQYEYVYADENAEPKSAVLDVRNTIIVYDNTLRHNKMFAVNYRPQFEKPTDEKPAYYDVIVADKEIVSNYKLVNDELELVSEEKHAFQDVPVVEYVNNKEYLGDFEPVISLIDAYNLIQSDRVNDREQLVDAILCFYGVKFSEEQMVELKEHRMMLPHARYCQYSVPCPRHLTWLKKWRQPHPDRIEQHPSGLLQQQHSAAGELCHGSREPSPQFRYRLRKRQAPYRQSVRHS